MASNPYFRNVVVLTGASSGIGREMALQLAEQGASIVLASRKTEQLHEVEELCHQRGGTALVVPTDVSEQSQCGNLVERTLNEFGRIDTLINNAGIGMYARFDEILDVCLIEKIMRVNFLGSVYCTYFALPYLKKTKGRLVGVSSLSGKLPSPMWSGYGASKHAMAGFFDSLRIELEDSGVSVTMAYFSWVATGISSRAVGADGEPLGSVLDHEADAIPVEDCAQLIIQAAAQRKREYIPLYGKTGLLMKHFFPKAIDRISQDTLE